jgi:hypothetical protein
MDNELVNALFRLDCIIVERQEKLIPLQWNISVESYFLRVTVTIRGFYEKRSPRLQCLSCQPAHQFPK